MPLTQSNELLATAVENMELLMSQIEFGLDTDYLTLKQGELMTLNEIMAGVLDIEENFVEAHVIRLKGLFACTHELFGFEYAGTRNGQAVYIYVTQQGNQNAQSKFH